jgi:hypothetical protein
MTQQETDLAERGYSGWAIVDLLGHQRVAGWVQPASVGGAHFVRLDVPVDDDKFATQLLGPGSIYKVIYCDAETARRAAQTLPEPISPYEVGASEREKGLYAALRSIAIATDAYLSVFPADDGSVQPLREELGQAEATLGVMQRGSLLAVAQEQGTREGERTFDEIPF